MATTWREALDRGEDFNDGNISIKWIGEPLSNWVELIDRGLHLPRGRIVPLDEGDAVEHFTWPDCTQSKSPPTAG